MIITKYDPLIIAQEIVDAIIEYRDEYFTVALKNDSRKYEVIQDFKNKIIRGNIVDYS